jgi:outer membrane protein assembly factor BamB
LVVGDLLFFGCKGGEFRCVSLKSHTEVWTYATGADIRSSPVLAGDGVLIGSYDGRLYAFSTGGKQKWSFDTESRIYSTPAITAGRAFFGDMTGWLYALGS